MPLPEQDRRVDLGSDLKGTIARAEEYFDVPEINISSVEEMYFLTKRERNGLIAIVIHNAFQRSLAKRAERPPYGFREDDYVGIYSTFAKVPITQLPGNINDPYYRPLLPLRIKKIEQNIAATVSNDLKDEVDEMVQAPDTDFRKPIYKRLATLIPNFSLAESQELRDKENVFYFIHRGIQTAVSTISRIHYLGVTLYEQNFGIPPRPQQLRDLCINSYPIAARLASVHAARLDIPFNYIKHPMDQSRFTPQLFVLEQLSNGQTRLNFKEGVWDKIEETMASEHVPSVTTSCPALVSSTAISGAIHTVAENPQSNVVKDLLAWFADAVAA